MTHLSAAIKLWFTGILRSDHSSNQLYRQIYSQLRPIQASLSCEKKRRKHLVHACMRQLDLGSLIGYCNYFIFHRKKGRPQIGGGPFFLATLSATML